MLENFNSVFSNNDLIELWKLSTIKRYNGSITTRDENVAEHTGLVCILCVQLYNTFPEFDLLKSLQMCAMHDVNEIYINDMPNQVKKMYPILEEKTKDVEIELTNNSRLFSKDTANLHIEFMENKTLEAKVANLCDCLGSMQFLLVDYMKGNLLIKPLLDESFKKGQDKWHEILKIVKETTHA